MQVCHHYLAPTLSQLPHDASLLKSPPSPGSPPSANAPAAPVAVPSPSFSASGSQSGTGDSTLLGEDGAENKENLPEPITEVKTDMMSYVLCSCGLDT